MVLKKRSKLVHLLLLSGLLLGIFFFLVFYKGGNITGAVISVGEGCSDTIVCKNETVTACHPEIVQQCSGECTSEMKEVCTDECVPQCSSEEVNGEMRESCITVCNPVCVMEEVKDCSGQVCQNVTQQKCEDQVVEKCDTETVCGSTPPIQGATVATENSSENSGLGLEGGLDISNAPTVTIILNSTNVSTNHTDVNLTAYNTTLSGAGTLKAIYGNWYRNNTPRIYFNMPFERINNSAGSNAWDYSGFGRNASENSGVLFNATGGYDNKGAYRFNNTGAFLRTSFPNLPAANGDITLVAWIRQDTIAGNQVVVSKGGSGICFGWGMFISAGQLWARNNANNHVLRPGDIKIIPDNWNHVAIVYNSSGAFGYINGTFVGNNSAATVSSCAGNSNLTIGVGGQDPSLNFSGYIDELTIWNMSLTAEQVKSLFNNRTEIVAAHTYRSENWSVLVTPNNGTGDGAEAMSNNITILNARPTQDTPVLNTTNISSNNTNVNLTAYNISTVDIDLDAVKNIYNWQVNGSSIALLNMPFDGGSLNSTDGAAIANGARDYARGINGTVNATWNASGGWDRKGAYEFDGLNNIITTATSTLTNLTAFTIMLWIKPKDDPDDLFMIGNTGNGLAHGWFIDKPTNRTAFLVGGTTDGQNSIFEAGNPILANSWTHLAISWDPSGFKAYMNGTLVDTGATTVSQVQWGNTANSAFVIGSYRSSGPLSVFNGTIDEVMIFNRTLSTEEVYMIYSNQSNILAQNETVKNSNWTMQITPNDGYADGDTIVSNNVTILNTGPTQITPVLNTTNISSNNTHVNLTLYPLNATDVDGDLNIKNITNWLQNGSSITLLNMPFEGINNSASSNAWDYSGYARNASENGNAFWNATGGYDGRGAYFFDGTDDFLQGSLPTNAAGANITVTAWIKPDAINDRLVFVKGNAGVCFGYGMNIRTVGLTAYNNNGAVTLGGGIEIDAWNFLAVVYNASGAFGYINGTFVGNSSAGTTSTCAATNYTIGIRAGDNTADYQGHVDDLMVWNRSLTAEQILALYNNRTDLIVGNETLKHQNWSVQVTPNDGYADGDTLASNVVAILNAPPTHATPILNTTNISLNASFLQNLTLYPQNATDTDGDVNIKNITNWFVNGTSVTLLNLPFEGGSQSGREVVNGTRDYTGININVTVFSEFNSSGGFDGRGAYVFNGSRYITTRVPATVGGENVTITAWVNPTAINDRMVIQTIGANAACFGYGMLVRNTGLAAATGAVTATLGGGIEANAWNFLTIVYNNSGAFGYINGTYVGNSSAATVTSCANINTTIGQSTPGANPFLGHIDEVMVWNRSLTQAEISALYNNRTDMIVSEELRKNQVWYAQVTPNDGQSDGDMLTSSNVTILDRIVPAVTFTGPVNNSNFSISTVSFNATVADLESQINTVLFMFNTNETPFNVTASNTSGTWNVSVNMSTISNSRIHMVTVFANDTENNVNSTQSINFTVDRIGPNITLNTLNNVGNSSNFSLSSNNQTFNVSVFDALTQVNTAYFWFDNGTGQDFNITGLNMSGEWLVSYNVSALVEGRQGVRVIANDTFGNVNNSVVVNFTIDKTNPVVTVTCDPFSSSIGENVVCTCSATDTLSQVRTATFSGGVTSLSFNVGSAGDHTTPGCLATDFSGNSISGVGSFTIVGSSGSSSGGSGGGSSSGSSGNFKKSTWASLDAGETATVQVDDTEIGVQEVEVTVNDLVNGIWLEVRRDNVPEEVQVKFKRKIYKDLEITAGPTLKYDQVEDAKVKFTVDKDWLKENAVPKENIALFRYVKLYLPQEVTAWAELPTDVDDEEESFVQYTAQTPGFSYFLIGEKIPEGKPVETVTQGKVNQIYLPEEVQGEEGALVGGAYFPFGEKFARAATANMDLIISGGVILFVIIMIGLLFGHTHKKKRGIRSQK